METLQPKLRFPEFEGNWRKVKLGDITTWASGGTPSKNIPEFWNGEIPWISASSMRGLEYSNSEYKITEKGLKTGSKLAKKGSLLLLVRGSMLFNKIPIGIVTRDVSFNQDVKSIVIDDSSTSAYILQWFVSFEAVILNMVTGTGIGAGKLDTQDLKLLELNLPSLKEQTKIANFLSSIDEKINLLKEKKALLEEYKKGMMQKIFNQEIRFKDENGEDFEEWEGKTLGEVGEFQTSSVDKLVRKGEDEVYLVNYMNVYRHESINNQNKLNLQIVTAKESQINVNNLKKGDILFTPSSETPDDIGHSVVIFEDLENCVYSYHLMRFRPKIKIDILYSHYFCNNSKVLSQISRLATGSTRFTISVKSFSSINVNLPCLKEQTKIANFLSALDEKISLVATQIEDMQEYKKGLLQQMFV